MHWNKLPNIWSRYIELDRKLLPRVRRFRRVKFNFQRAAQQCYIKLHQQDASGTYRVQTCTVAEVIEKYLRPGRWIVPKGIPPEAFQALESSRTMFIDYRNNEPYSAALEYVLVDFQTQLGPRSEMVLKRGPQMFMLDCLPDFPSRDQRVVSKAFESLLTGKVSTFAITTKFNLTKKQPQSLLEQRGLPLYEDYTEHSADMSRLISMEDSSNEIVSSDQQESGCGHASRDGSTDKTDLERQGPSTKDIEAPMEQQMIATATLEDHHAEITIPEEHCSHSASITQLDHQTPPKSLAQQQRHLEDQAWQRRIESSQNPMQDNSKLRSRKETSLSPTLYPAPPLIQSETALYPSNYSAVQQVDKDDLTEKVEKDEDDVESDLAASQDSPIESAIDIKEPFGKQIFDNSLTLRHGRRRGRALTRPSIGTYRVLTWASKFMPHLWPEVILACMPAGCKIDVKPRTDRGSLQYVIKPPIESAIKAVLHDLTVYDSKNWV